MVARAIEKGYEYYAICDHSQRLRDERLEQQRAAIDALNEQVPITLLKGIEVNIRVNGELDVDDEDARRGSTGSSRRCTTRSRRTRPGASGGDGEPVRRLHRPRHEPQDRQAGAVGGRRRARDREGARDRHVPRDQLAARPARPDRRPRARRPRGRPEARHRLRRAPGLGARLRRARRGAGAARVADEGRRRQHAHARRSCGSCARSDDASATTSTRPPTSSPRTSNTVGERPVVPAVAPGDVRAALPESPPEHGEPFMDVLRDVEELIAPALTHWNHPRFFAYFAHHRLRAGHPRRAADRGVQRQRDGVVDLAGRRPSSSR